MRINFVSLQTSLLAVGARRIVAYARGLDADARLYHVLMENGLSFRDIIRKRDCSLVTPEEALRIAEPVADADIVAFSAYTDLAEQTKAVIKQVRRINPKAYILWGGIHPIMDSEDAIQHADAICTGEGEFAFAEFLDAYRNGRDYTTTRNFWFRQDGEIIRNAFRPLMTPGEMSALPLPIYGHDEQGYIRSRGSFAPLTLWDYIDFIGLSYHTIWTVGCPFKCTFCGNTRLLDNDKTYSRLRYPDPQWLVNEINAARSVQPHIRSVVFHDDSFLALPLKRLEQFAEVYTKEVGLPFCVMGVIPNYVRRDKIELLLEAGLNRVRMGVQSGSQRILDFYKRPTPIGRVKEAASILTDYSRYMIPPYLDFIVDNPIETREDIVDTLELLYNLPRPYSLNLFSLRIMPNTDLAKQVVRDGLPFESLNRNNYKFVAPTLANCLIVWLAFMKPPRWVFDRLLKRVHGVADDQPQYAKTLYLLHLLFLAKKAWGHLRVMDFSVIPGRISWFLDRIGFVSFWHRHFVRKYKRPTPDTPEGDRTETPLEITLPVINAA